AARLNIERYGLSAATRGVNEPNINNWCFSNHEDCGVAYCTSAANTTTRNHCAIQVTVMAQRSSIDRKFVRVDVFMDAIRGQVNKTGSVVAVYLPLIGCRCGN